MNPVRQVVAIFCIVVLCNAGVSAKERYLNRIVNGVAGDIKNFPYQVSIENHGFHMCGGSIINSEWILSAAHCIDGEVPWTITIRAGSSIKETGGQVRRLQGMIKHANYNNKTYDYDIALLRVASPLAFGPGVEPITMSTYLPPDGTVLTLSGWGALRFEGASPTQLQTVNVSISSKTDCALKYTLTDRMFCAYADGKDSCQGDSGGPAVMQNAASGNPILIGVVSFGNGCATAGYPGVYEDVFNLRPWIKQYVGI